MVLRDVGWLEDRTLAAGLWGPLGVALRKPWGSDSAGGDAVAEVDHAIAEAPLVEQLEGGLDPVRQRGVARADDDRRQVQLELVDQPGAKRLRSELRPRDAEVALRLGLHAADGLGVELALHARPRGGGRLERARVDDLVGRPPDLREVAHQRMLVVHGLPHLQHVVHAAPEQPGPERPGELVDVRMDVLVREGPVPLALLVGDVAVERRDRGVDEPRHGRDRSPSALRGQAAAARTSSRRSSATAYATRDPLPMALATDRECAVAASPAAYTPATLVRPSPSVTIVPSAVSSQPSAAASPFGWSRRVFTNSASRRSAGPCENSIRRRRPSLPASRAIGSVRTRTPAAASTAPPGSGAPSVQSTTSLLQAARTSAERTAPGPLP